MSYTRPDALVSTEWLAAHLDAPDVRVVDGSFYLPAQKRDAKAEYAARHIPGAVFFDIEEISDVDNPLPHMMPAPEKFSARVRKLGLGDGNRIVVYDGSPMMGATRVWWMFRAFGHKDVAVLDGGLPKWIAEGRSVTDEPPQPRERHFTARLDFDSDPRCRPGDATDRQQGRADRRCPRRAAFPRRGTRAAAKPAAGPHAGCAQHALQRSDRSEDRHHAAGGAAQGEARRRRHRSGEEGNRKLRLGRQRLCRRPGALSHRRQGNRDLRRLVGRMGLAPGHADRHRRLTEGAGDGVGVSSATAPCRSSGSRRSTG